MAVRVALADLGRDFAVPVLAVPVTVPVVLLGMVGMVVVVVAVVEVFPVRRRAEAEEGREEEEGRLLPP